MSSPFPCPSPNSPAFKLLAETKSLGFEARSSSDASKICTLCTFIVEVKSMILFIAKSSGLFPSELRKLEMTV